MRDEPVPCKNATLFEINQGRHITWEDDRTCKPCKRVLERFAQRGAEAEAEAEVDVRTAAAVHPSEMGPIPDN
jgi:hypothetical protein